MISLTILELLYLVLIFFITIIGTLLIIALLRLLKILQVGTEVADIYFKIKEVLVQLAIVPEIIKEKILESFSKNQDSSESK